MKTVSSVDTKRSRNLLDVSRVNRFEWRHSSADKLSMRRRK